MTKVTKRATRAAERAMEMLLGAGWSIHFNPKKPTEIYAFWPTKAERKCVKNAFEEAEREEKGAVGQGHP